MSEKVLTHTLRALEKAADGQSKVKVGEVVEALNSKGIDALLIPPAFIALSPAGMIPGMPAFCGIFIALVSIHIIMDRHSLWLPARFEKHPLKTKKFLTYIKRIKPYTKKFDKLTKRRLSYFSKGYVKRIIGCICLLLSTLMIGLGFIPFMPAILALPVLVFALGMISKDGMIILGGFLFTLATSVTFFWLIGGS